MLICMKPTSKQINTLQARISEALKERPLSNAELGRLSKVHPSQVSRIRAGNFKTFSNNVVQICRVLGVRVPRIEPEGAMDPEWRKAQASMRRIWNETPEGAIMIRRVLDAIADLQAQPRQPQVGRPAGKP